MSLYINMEYYAQKHLTKLLMSKCDKITGIIYIHIGMNEWVKCYAWEFPHKT